MGSLCCGLALGAVGSFAWVTYTDLYRKKNDDSIIFAEKDFADLGDQMVGISGTLTGQGLGYPNNTFSIVCFKEQRECWIADVQQIGENQIGRMDYAYSIPVKQWSAYEVIAIEDVTGWSCKRITITISRKTQTALWVEEPINQTLPMCKNVDTQIHKYTIEDSPGWKQIHEKARR